MKERTGVRIPCASRDEMAELALRLEADGYRVVRGWRTVTVRTATPAEGERLAQRLGVSTQERGGRVPEPGPAESYAGWA